jgi:hypothetical protein
LSANLLAALPILFHNLQIVPANVPQRDRTGGSGLSPAKGEKKSWLNSLPAKDLGG